MVRPDHTPCEGLHIPVEVECEALGLLVACQPACILGLAQLVCQGDSELSLANVLLHLEKTADVQADVNQDEQGAVPNTDDNGLHALQSLYQASAAPKTLGPLSRSSWDSCFTYLAEAR